MGDLGLNKREQAEVGGGGGNATCECKLYGLILTVVEGMHQVIMDIL